jgi:hypothetical protein
VDVVLLETNDGRPHLQQALEVMKAGKPLFIDKPVAGTLEETVAIFEAARKYKAPVFSASSLRYMTGMQDIAPAGRWARCWGRMLSVPLRWSRIIRIFSGMASMASKRWYGDGQRMQRGESCVYREHGCGDGRLG